MTQLKKIFSGRYKLHSLLGTGGMGEVYLARDMQLHRLVAIKLLATDYVGDQERLRRFEQEAYAASALNHHGIVTIYEIGRTDAAPFIAMEYIEGQTLRQRLKQARLTESEALGIATQVTEAIAAAHKAGIIHRDIKPENIMLRKDGYVKVLDFGLAKLNEARVQETATPEASTMTNIHTGQGAVLGTAAYMSPEQVRGQEIDGRTDIWSMGVVLYEMLTVSMPFKGHTTGEVIVSILEREPEPLVHQSPAVTAGLQSVIATALRKNRNERYQTADELLADLRRYRRRLELRELPHSDTNSNGSNAWESQPRGQVTARTDESEAFTTGRRAAFTGDRPAEASVKRDSAATGWYGRRNYAFVFLTLLFVVVSYVAYRLYTEQTKRVSAPSLQFQRLSMPGNVREAVISSDGKYVASVVDENSSQSLHVMEIATSKDIRVGELSEKGYTGLCFSPDSTFIYYLEHEAETKTLFRVSKLGGGLRKLLSGVNTPVTFSPDGARMAFVRYDMKEQTTVLMTANADGTDERMLATRKRPEYYPVDPDEAGPAWSPDGEVIACATVDRSGGLKRMNIEAVSVKDGSARRINTAPWFDIARLLWLADGSGLVMACSGSLMEPSQLSLVSYPDGAVHKITNDANYYNRVSLTNDSSTMLAFMSDYASSIWVMPVGHAEQAKQLSGSQNEGVWGMAGLPDGRFVYSSRNVGDYLNIWAKKADGSDQKQLTFETGVNYQPTVSPDGRLIVFVSSRAGALNIWRMNSDGTQPVQLTRGGYEDMPQVTPDGRWVIYHSSDAVRKISIEGGEPILLLKKNTLHPVVSPDGKMLACYTLEPVPGAAWKLEVFALDDMTMVKQYSLPPTVDIGSGLRWTPDGRGLAYVLSADDASNVLAQALDGGPTKSLTDFKEAQLFAFGWSADGQQIWCVRGVQTFKVVLIKGFSWR